MYNERLTMSSQNLTVIDGSMNVSRRIHSSLQSDGPNIKPNGLCCVRIALITPEPHEVRPYLNVGVDWPIMKPILLFRYIVIMSDVFISYFLRDIDFVRHLFDQLKARDREAWADWQDIPPTADWLAEIYRGIEAADSFLFIISPDSVVSEICTLEIEHAIQHNKWLVPVVLHDVVDDRVHSENS